MDILVFLVLFLGGIIQAACHGDYSGVKFLGQIIAGIALFIMIGTCPWLFVIIVIIAVLIAIGCGTLNR